MANFQFGQDNVGSNWQVPSWYVQGMSQSPMAASIAGIGNSIAAFASGYQAARQAERNYGMEQARLGLSERQVGLQESESLQRKKLIEQQAADARNEEARRKRLAEYQMWLLEGGRTNQSSSGAASADVLRNVNMVPATESQAEPPVPSGYDSSGYGSGIPLIPFYLQRPSR